MTDPDVVLQTINLSVTYELPDLQKLLEGNDNGGSKSGSLTNANREALERYLNLSVTLPKIPSQNISDIIKEMETRKRIAGEVYTTEKTYVLSLKLIMDVRTSFLKFSEKKIGIHYPTSIKKYINKGSNCERFLILGSDFELSQGSLRCH